MKDATTEPTDRLGKTVSALLAVLTDLGPKHAAAWGAELKAVEDSLQGRSSTSSELGLLAERMHPANPAPGWFWESAEKDRDYKTAIPLWAAEIRALMG